MAYPGLGAWGWLGRRSKARRLYSHESSVSSSPRFETLEPRLLLHSVAGEDAQPETPSPQPGEVIEVDCPGHGKAEAVAGEWILRVGVGGATVEERRQALQSLIDGIGLEATVGAAVGIRGSFLIHTDPAMECHTLEELLSTVDGFAFVEPNYVYRNDEIGPSTPLSPLPPHPSVSIGDGVVAGSRGHKIKFTVTLTGPSDEVITVDYATGDGTAISSGRRKDYKAVAGKVSFQPGETSKTITIQVNRNRLLDPTENFHVDLLNPTNAAVADTRGTAVIAQDTRQDSLQRIKKLIEKSPLRLRYSLMNVFKLSRKY